MSFKIYHQVGHNSKWNIDSLRDDGCGDGLIIAPRFIEREKVEKLPRSIKENSIFDPQFFLPATPKGKLETYDFFPDIAAGGFDTSDYLQSCADLCAEKCVQFQIRNRFNRIIIPTRHYRGSQPDFIDQQASLFVNPFINELKRKGSPPSILQLIINDLMLKDSEYISDILNWVTSLEINGVYLITELRSTSKQIKDSEFLLNLLDFIDALKDNELEVVLGYLNTESILLSIANPDVLTMGSYENMRSFNIRTFEDIDDDRQTGPNPRLYTSQLLQWIEYQFIGAIRRVFPNPADIFDINKYQAYMFEKSFRWHFTKPQLYKHHFLVMSGQLKQLSELPIKKKYIAVKEMIRNAIRKYKELDNKGIIFDSNSDGSHLPIWLTVANIYGEKKGWR